MPTVPLGKRPRRRSGGYMHWRRSKPFVVNERAKLVHRPRYVSAHKCADREPHIAIEHHCGMTVTGRGDKLSFVDYPDEDATVCRRCEEKAVEKGLPTSEGLAGRHVHKGSTKVFRDCGCEE